MRRLPAYDSSTGLPDRNFYINRLRRHLKYENRLNRITGTALYINIENFKLIEDIYGAKFSNLIIDLIVDGVRGYVDDNPYKAREKIARISNDSFLFFCLNIKDEHTAASLANSILNRFKGPISFDDNNIYISMNIGIALYPDHAQDVDMLINCAKIASAMLIDNNKNSFKIYKNDTSKDITATVPLKSELKYAIQQNQFELHYHPQIDLRSNEIVSLEVLTRWRHPKRGLIYPNNFIPLAEKSQLIIPMGEIILEMACRQLKKWHRKRLTKCSISVNISAIQLQQRYFAEKVQDILAKAKLAPSYLELEITEHSLITNIEQAINTLNELHEMGVKISLDDFGTGYSSLEYLNNLPVDIIKVDKSFIDNIDSKRERAIINAIIIMGRDMNLCVTAEGVEVEEQLNILKEQRCDRAQGFLFTKPMPKEQAEKILAK